MNEEYARRTSSFFYSYREQKLDAMSAIPEYGELPSHVVMVIRAPRGRMVLYSTIPNWHYGVVRNRQHQVNVQCKAIKAFMEQHRYD